MKQTKSKEVWPPVGYVVPNGFYWAREKATGGWMPVQISRYTCALDAYDILIPGTESSIIHSTFDLLIPMQYPVAPESVLRQQSLI